MGTKIERLDFYIGIIILLAMIQWHGHYINGVVHSLDWINILTFSFVIAVRMWKKT